MGSAHALVEVNISAKFEKILQLVKVYRADTIMKTDGPTDRPTDRPTDGRKRQSESIIAPPPNILLWGYNKKPDGYAFVILCLSSKVINDLKPYIKTLIYMNKCIVI